MQEWLDVDLPMFDEFEQRAFDNLYQKGVNNINGWSEEDLKMKFFSFVLELGNMSDDGKVVTFFDKKLSGIVEGISLTVKSDFMLAKGFMNIYDTPFFHFQAGGVPQYKPQINPTGEPMAQLLEAFLIAEEKTKHRVLKSLCMAVKLLGNNGHLLRWKGKNTVFQAFMTVQTEKIYSK